MRIPEAGAWLATPSPQTSAMTSPALSHQEDGSQWKGSLGESFTLEAFPLGQAVGKTMSELGLDPL